MNSKGTFRLPRRGRIRAALILIAAVAVVLVLSRRDSASKKVSADSGTAQHAIAADSPGRADSRQLRQTTSRAIRTGATLSAEDVEALVRRYPPRLHFSTDTITVGHGQLALFYSLDTALQSSAKRHISRYHPKYGAVVALHPETGRILALVSYTNPEETPLAHDLYARSIFPAASIVKIVTAAAAIERAGFKPQDSLPTCGANHTLYKSQLEKHLKTSREVTLREAFAYSINPVFGRIGIHVLGSSGLGEYLTKFGFNTQIPCELAVEVSRAHAGDSAYELAELASGFNQSTVISPIFGALMAATVSNEGSMPVPILADSIADIRSNTIVYRAKPRSWRMPMRRETALMMRDLMGSVARFGTARKSFVYVKRSGRFDNIEYGGKTGNVDLEGVGRVDWFVGYARHKKDPSQHIATCVVTVHGPYWTVHSSFLGAEIIRNYIRNLQIASEKASAEADTANISRPAPPSSSGYKTLKNQARHG